MIYIGIDPGANYTGLAVLDNAGMFVYHAEYNDPIKLFCDLLDLGFLNVPCAIALEDMIGSGRRDSFITKTIKVLGYIENRIREYARIYAAPIVLELVPNSARLAFVMLVPDVIAGKDEKSAAAHALALRNRRNNR